MKEIELKVKLLENDEEYKNAKKPEHTYKIAEECMNLMREHEGKWESDVELLFTLLKKMSDEGELDSFRLIGIVTNMNTLIKGSVLCISKEQKEQSCKKWN